MNKRFLICCAVIALTICDAYSQQLPLFTQYRDLQTVINPAALSADYFIYDNNVSIGASFRTQWVGLSNNPQTATLRGDYFNSGGSGFSLLAGGHLISDQTGPTGFMGAYAKIGGVISGDPEYSGLAVALNFGMVQYRVDITEIKFRDENDIIATENQSELFPDAGFGLFYYQNVGGASDMLYGGISVPQLFGADLSFNADSDEFKIQRLQHIYALAGYYKYYDSGAILEPSLWVKSVGSQVNIQGSLKYQFPSTLWIGTGASSSGIYHMETGVGIGLGSNYPNLRIGYSYDYAFSKISPATRASHQFNISYSFDY